MSKKVIKIESVRQKVIEKIQPKKRVCAYCRVSTDLLKQHTSYEAQKVYYKEYILRNPQWEFAEIFADRAKSGTKIEKREEFLRMISECECGKIDMIITKSITRFARNTLDSIEVLRKLKELSVEVYFEKENINTASEKSEQLITILSSLAQGESENISENCRWAIRKRFMEGSYVPSCVAYGYTKNENGELIIHEKQAKIVRHIYQDYLSGKGAYAIAKELTESGIPSARAESVWHEHVVKEILNNPIYAGDMLLQKTYTTEALPFIKKTNKGERPQFFLAENHVAIISREEMGKVKNIFEKRRILTSTVDGKKGQNRYEFSGKIICGNCGSIYRRQKAYIGTEYETVRWCCNTHIKDIKKCHMKAIREDLIKSTYLTMWNKLVTGHKYILEPLLKSLKQLKQDKHQEDEIKNIESRIMELTEQGHILSRVATKGYIDPAIFIEKQNVLNMEMDELKKRKGMLVENGGYHDMTSKTEYLLELIQCNPFMLEEYSSELFINTVEKVIIEENSKITFSLINGLELTEQIKE